MKLGEFQTYLDNLSKKFEVMPKKILDKIGSEVLLAGTQRTFYNQGKRSGGTIVAIPDGTAEGLTNQKWRPFSEVTFKINPKRRGGMLLQQDGNLRNSVGYSFRGDKTIEFGSRYRLASIHHFGANIKMFGKIPAKIPSRPFVYVTDYDIERMENIVKIVIDEVLN